jgi:deferrochelatase/peroxidase EfeB
VNDSMLLSDEDRADIQGLLTTGYGHLGHAGFLLVRFADPGPARDWLRDLLPQITTAEPWEKTEAGEKLKPNATLHLAFTYDGLVALGLPAETQATMPTEFVVGMAARAPVLGDHGESAPARWEIGGPDNPPVHAMLIVHAVDVETLTARFAELRQGLAASGVEPIAEDQVGKRQPRSREQFGFANDGISEPGIEGLRKEDTPSPWVLRRGEFILGHVNETGLYPQSPSVAATHDPNGVLAPFPLGALPSCRDFGRNGTFLVYRKLRQHVAEFWRFIQSSCDPDMDDGGGHERAMLRMAAKFMGRWPSGAPLTVSPEDDDPSLADFNEFMYRASDERGFGCPVGAHIRRANPRDSLKRVKDPPEESIASVNQHRIIRRGISFGEPLFPPERIEQGRAPVDLDDSGGVRGLHFVALNANTKLQFEFIQQTWLNNPTFDGLNGEKDPVLGDNDGTAHMTIPQRPVRRRVADVQRFVTVMGGAYYFMPSVRAMRFLAGP